MGTCLVKTETTYYSRTGHPHLGFYLHPDLKTNIDNYFIKAVEKNWDCVIGITGMEGSGKTTAAMTFAKYVDESFPGEPLNDRSNRRTLDRVVFTFDQFMKAIDAAQPGQAIVFDEAVMAMNAQDASSELQKILIKKMTMIRKKRLYLFLLIPTIFMLRRYFAVSRMRALVHFYTPDGITRGYFKFYNYEDKRKLYFRGFKEWNQNATPPSFKGRTTDTSWYFFNQDDYEEKKDAAIKELTEAPKKERTEKNDRNRRIREERDKAVYYIYHVAEKLRGKQEKKFTMEEFRVWLKNNVNISFEREAAVRSYSTGRKLVVNNSTTGNQEDGSTLFTDKD